MACARNSIIVYDVVEKHLKKVDELSIKITAIYLQQQRTLKFW